MKDILIHFGEKKLYLNNNNDKYNRAKKEAGGGAIEFEILAHYDNLGGFIQDEHGHKLENGQFWQKYQEWKVETEKMKRTYDENIDSIHVTEAQLLTPLNENVAQKRTFLGTLMTIAAAIIAGLFFLFSNDYIPPGREGVLAKISGILYSIFIFTSGFWLAAILGQESTVLDKKLRFYREFPEEMSKKLGKEVRSQKAFENYLVEKLAESKSLETKIYFGSEYYFYDICGVFLLASLPIIILFLMAGN